MSLTFNITIIVNVYNISNPEKVIFSSQRGLVTEIKFETGCTVWYNDMEVGTKT